MEIITPITNADGSNVSDGNGNYVYLKEGRPIHVHCKLNNGRDRPANGQ